MSVPEASHRPLLAGLKIHAGVPKGTGKDANYFASGTLTGLATRTAWLLANPHALPSRAEVCCAVPASKTPRKGS